MRRTDRLRQLRRRAARSAARPNVLFGGVYGAVLATSLVAALEPRRRTHRRPVRRPVDSRRRARLGDGARLRAHDREGAAAKAAPRWTWPGSFPTSGR
ncbi:hypothetical protein ACU686_37580 [Yinghuangia aomiensis]